MLFRLLVIFLGLNRLHPLPSRLHARNSALESLALFRHRALGTPSPPDSAPALATSLSTDAQLRRQEQREEAEERDGARRLAGWGLDAKALCEEVGGLLGRCDPALWLHHGRRDMADETFAGVVLVVLALAQVSERRVEGTKGVRA